MKLTPHQNQALEESLDLLRINNFVVIQGSAGVGKTTMVNSLIKRLPKSKGRRLVCSAPTHKALAVLSEKVDQIQHVDFATIHSLLKMKMQYTKNGKKDFKPSYSEKYPPLKHVAYVVLDEASMIGKDMLKFITHFAPTQNTKIIFIGDIKQINPVGEDDSPVFMQDYPTVELTEIIRQGANNPIIALSRDLERIKTREADIVPLTEKKAIGFEFSSDTARVIKNLAAVNGTNQLKYLAWTNKEVDSINKRVRDAIYTNPRKIEQGESIILNAPYGEQFQNNEEIKVNTLIVATHKFSYFTAKGLGIKTEQKVVELKCYFINPLQPSKPQLNSIAVIHEDSEQEYTKICRLLKNRAINRQIPWVDYYDFLNGFADYKYNHAISVHKSQGSSFKNVILNVRNLKLNRNKVELERLLYTAVTRASDLLILYKA